MMNEFKASKNNLSSIDDSRHEEAFIDLALQRLGLIIHPNNHDLHQTIVAACRKFECSPDYYLEKLKECSESSPLLKHFIAGITVGETYFFRDKQQVQLLKIKVLPAIIARKREQKNLSLRIWSAGCATGEEIFTAAMLLDELLPDIQQWKITLLGTDINTSSLQQARLGHYKKWSMRSICDNYIQKYFKESDNQFHLTAKIKDSVNFLYLNLNDNTYPSILNGTNSQDLIICRNVLIYFNQDCIIKLMKKISSSLAPGGFLLLGASDPIYTQDTVLLCHHHDGMLFSRPMNKPASEENKQIVRPKISKFTPKLPTTLKTTKDQKLILSPGKELCLKAKEAANLGQLEQAIHYCEQSLKIDGADKEAYFISALIFIEQNQVDKAESSLKKTLFLDRKFVEGHFQLGLLLLKNKRYREGLKSLQNALVIVNSKESTAVVPDSQGLTYQRFAEIINAEIALYSEAGSLTNEHKK